MAGALTVVAPSKMQSLACMLAGMVQGDGRVGRRWHRCALPARMQQGGGAHDCCGRVRLAGCGCWAIMARLECALLCLARRCWPR
jgi:hypothetical protein